MLRVDVAAAGENQAIDTRERELEPVAAGGNQDGNAAGTPHGVDIVSRDAKTIIFIAPVCRDADEWSHEEGSAFSNKRDQDSGFRIQVDY
jgi:hypothetical protein